MAGDNKPGPGQLDASEFRRRLASVEFNEAPRVCDGGSNFPRAEAREGRKGGSAFQFLIGNQVRIEFPVTYSKQRTDANSNR
jgi:hypothetical protein